MATAITSTIQVEIHANGLTSAPHYVATLNDAPIRGRISDYWNHITLGPYPNPNAPEWSWWLIFEGNMFWILIELPPETPVFHVSIERNSTRGERIVSLFELTRGEGENECTAEALFDWVAPDSRPPPWIVDGEFCCPVLKPSRWDRVVEFFRRQSLIFVDLPHDTP